MSVSSLIRRQSVSKVRPRARLGLEALEDRLAPAVQLTYAGPGSVLSLQELLSGATPSVTVSEQSPGQLRIDLGAHTFDPASTAAATGLAYGNGSPGTSHFATVDIGTANSVTNFQAALPGDGLTVGVIANASGGLGNVAASAAAITVTGLDTSHAGAGNGDVDLKAAGALTVAAGAQLETGSGTISLAAGVNPDGTASGNAGTLSIGSGATVVSDNTGNDAITLRGTDLDIDLSAAPALVGAHRIVGSTPSATLSGVDTPQALAIDADGNLYVASGAEVPSGENTVSVFSPGSTTPTRTLTGLDNPTALAVDIRGNLFVANFGGADGDTVSVFAPGQTTATSTLTGLTAPNALAFDAAGNLYVTNFLTGTVSVFEPGSTTPDRTLTGLRDPNAVTVDANGNVFVLNFVGAFVSKFAPDSTTPTDTLFGLSNPTALAVDAAGNLYVANNGTSTVSVFAPGSSTPTSTLTGLNNPSALALDAQGNLYVANEGSFGSGVGTTVSVFAPGSTTPTATLTGLNTPTGLAFNPDGNLFVMNSGGTVSVFTHRPASGGVVVRTAKSDQAINVGPATGTGMTVSNAELAQLFATGAVTFGDTSQTGNITFAAATAGSGVAAVQSPTGPGSITLDGSADTALSTGAGNIHLSAGTGGIVATGANASLASTGQVSLDAAGSVGAADHRVLFDAVATPAVTIGASTAPSGGVYLGGLGSLTLAGVHTDNADLDVTAAADLAVARNTAIDTGSGKLALSAGVKPDGQASGNAGVLSFASGTTVVSDNAGSDAITLRGSDIDINTGALAAIIGGNPGSAGGVVVRTAQPNQFINLGATSGPGLTLSSLELGRIFTTATGTLTFGDTSQTGNIFFAGVTPATAGASVVAVQSATDPGVIFLDNSAGTALAVGSGNIRLSAGTGGIVASSANTSLSSSGQVHLDTAGGVGSADSRILFGGAATPAVTVGGSTAPGGGIYLGGLGSLTLASVNTNNAALDVTAAATLIAAGALSGSDVTLSATAMTVNQGVAVTAGDGNTLTVRADTLNLLGTLSAGSGLVVLTPSDSSQPIDLGGTGPNTHLVLDDGALGRVTAGTLRIGDAGTHLGNITVTRNITSHPGYDTLSLQSGGTINAINGATIAVENLALQAGTGIGTTGALAIDAPQLAFASQGGAIRLSNAGAVTLTGVDTLLASSIPGDVYTSQQVGSVYTLLHSGGVSGRIGYNGQALPEGATLTLADGNHYRVSYQGNGGQDVTLTRIANPAPSPLDALTATPVLSQVTVQRSQGGRPQGATLTFNGPVNLDPRALRLVRMRKGRVVQDLSRRIQIVMLVHNGQTWVQLRFRSPKGEPLARGQYSLFVHHDLVRHALSGAALTGLQGSGHTEIRFAL